jgi:membrane protein required for colicin V production
MARRAGTFGGAAPPIRFTIGRASSPIKPADAMASLPINAFDAVVYLCLIVAVIFGFGSGLLRSLATIFAYVAAAPITLVLAPAVTPQLIERFQMSPAQVLLVVAAIFVVFGVVLGALFRRTISALVGPTPSFPDRLAGAVLGAVRIGLLAVLMVMIFDRIIPEDREPAWLSESRLRPILSQAGQMGLKSLPPDVADYIDRLKRARDL